MKRQIRSIFRPVLVAIIAAIGVFSLSACKDWKNSTPQEKAAYFTEKAAKKLDLTDLQKEKLQALGLLVAQSVEEMKTKHKPIGEDFGELFSREQTTSADFEELFTSRRGSIESKVPEIAAAIADFQSSLEPEQRTKVASFLKRFGDRSRR